MCGGSVPTCKWELGGCHSTIDQSGKIGGRPLERIRARVWTEHFLGTRNKAEEFLELMGRLDGGRWLPDKWGHFEPIRSPYDSAAIPAILESWTEERGGRIANTVLFRKIRPSALITITVWRGRVPGLNSISAEFDASAFSADHRTERLKRLSTTLYSWCEGVYASVFQSNQAHVRSAQRTPQERLERIDWLNIFGDPYIELFGGRQRVLSAPTYQAEEVKGGIMLISAPNPDSAEMTQSAKHLIAIEDYLGADVFAGRGYPSVPCRVPRFNLSETVNK